MSNEVTIVTEGDFDAKVLERIFKGVKLNSKYKIVPASGYSSALSKAKSLLTLKNDRVLLLLDTDSIEENEIREKIDFVKSYINGSGNNNNFKIVEAIPEFEIIFLNNKKFLHELTSKKPSNDLLELGKLSPKKVLENLSHKKRESFIEILNSKEVRDEFFKQSPIKDIYEFIDNE